jgi:putative CocE/NonD family hydrolase
MNIRSRIIGRRWRLPPPVSRDIVEHLALPIPMRDGVELLTDRYHPRGGEQLPVILIRSPYGRGGQIQSVAIILAERGFQILLQSCRGTGGSGGVLHPSFNEERDGADTIDWIGRQPWYCGKLALMGTSYLGNAAWAAAHAAGSKIAAMALHATLSDARAETYAFDGFTLEGCLTWTYELTRQTLQPQRPSALGFLLGRRPRSRLSEPALQRALETWPLRDADQIAVGQRVSWWQEWIDHAEPGDPFWKPIDYSGVAATAPPTALISGWHDIFLPWQVKDFEAMQAAGREVSLTIGPWTHSAPAAVRESVRQALFLFRAQLLNQPAPPRSPVRLYVLGADEWREYAAWPPPGTNPVTYYLSPGGVLSTAPPPSSDPTRYDYDPSYPTPAVLGPRLQSETALGDMAELERRTDVLLFTTAPLAADLDAVGPVSADLFFRSSLEHTDFFLCLCDVDPQGRSTNVCDGYIRVRPNRPAPLSDGTRLVKIDFWPTAYRFRKAHRMRVIVASGAHPRYARNPGSGETLGDATTLTVAHQQILHDPDHPSRLTLPLAPTAT